MRKFLLLVSLGLTGLGISAQQAHKDIRLERMLIERPVVMQTNRAPSTPHTPVHSTGRAAASLLNSQRIGSAGNLLTIISGECNQIDVNDSLNLVTFIHRMDPTGVPGTNVAQYGFDYSKNRGLNWTSNKGPITNSPGINNIDSNGRFPQGVIYNPAGNMLADSAYLVYSGTWHNAPPNGTTGSWQGQMRGRGQFGVQPTDFNVHIDVLNGGQVAIASGMCQAPSGTFWNLNQQYTGTFATGSPQLTQGLIIQKGVWNPTTKDVDWTNTIVPQTFQTQDASGTPASVATSFNIAFDPTGQFGWVACLGDITVGDDSVYEPIFWKTIDAGANWTGPYRVNLDSLQGVVSSLNPFLVDGSTPASMNPSTTFEADLTVDVNGNPHLLTTIGSGTEWSILAAGYGVWDITYNVNAIAGCEWQGIHLADIFTLRGTFSGDNPAQTADNRPLVSRSPDAHKVFFFWNESDFQFVGSTDNDIPNLFGRAIDVVDAKITDLYNFTEGDSLWGGETSNTSGGVMGGSIFPTVGQTCLVNGNIYNVPLVMTQVDYVNWTQGSLGSSVQPAAFWYISNINIPASDFANPLDQVPPTITLNGLDTVYVLVNTPYTEAGSSAFDCTDGVITPTIQNAPDTSVAGIYEVLYIATDAAGNSDTVIRTVIVGAPPVCDFNWSFPVFSYRAQFQDQSLYIPTSYLWNFGDGGGSTQKNPLHTFPTNGTYNVCLTASNNFGTCTQVCKQVTITGVGIEELALSQQVTMFPNPTSGKVYLSFEKDYLPEFTATVYNVLGEIVLAPAKYSAGTSRVEMNLSAVSNGVYLVKIQTARETMVKQLTLARNN